MRGRPRPAAVSLLAAVVAFVHSYKEPTLARRFGAEYEADRKQAPGWWPRLPRRTPGSYADARSWTRHGQPDGAGLLNPDTQADSHGIGCD